MQYVIGSIVVLATLALALGAITGRVKINSCCAPADPADDRRMLNGRVRRRFEQPTGPTGHRSQLDTTEH